MTLLALLLVTGAHLAAWVGLFRFVTPRWRVALALLLPPLVALHWWERAESTDARERRQALWVLGAWLGTFLFYVLWTSVT